MMKYLLSCIVLCCFVSACSITPKQELTHKYYLLDDMPTAADSELESVVVIKRITVPDYLNQRNLVLRQLNQQIIIANLHSWADDLPTSIHRVLTRDLNRKTERFQIEADCRNCNELTIDINHFYPTDAGNVVLAGSYLLVQAGSNAQTQQHFSFEGALGADGYNEAVVQMRRLLKKLSDDIKLTILRERLGS